MEYSVSQVVVVDDKQRRNFKLSLQDAFRQNAKTKKTSCQVGSFLNWIKISS